jgi:hypothetical protein
LGSNKTTSESVASTSSILKIVPDLTKAKPTESQRRRVATAFDEELDKVKITMQKTTTSRTKKEEKTPASVSTVATLSKSSQGSFVISIQYFHSKVQRVKTFTLSTDFTDTNPIFSFSSNDLEKKKGPSPPIMPFDFNQKSEAILQNEEKTSKEKSTKMSTTPISSTTEEKIEKQREDKQSLKEPSKRKLNKKSAPNNFGNYFEILGSQQDEENEPSKEKEPTNKENKEGLFYDNTFSEFQLYKITKY